jgi:methionyl-tRNA synthetase
MNLEGQKISGSRNWVIDGLDALTRFDPDPLRYYLTMNMPETKDTDWDWDGFFHRNNDELVGTWGNLANRVLSFAYKHWEGHVPAPAALRAEDEEILRKIDGGFGRVGEQFDAVHLRNAISETMALASDVNKYLDTMAPWSEVKTNKQAAATTIYVALRVIDSLKVMFAPFLPFTCERLHAYLGYTEPLFGGQRVEDVQDELGDHAVLRYIPNRTDNQWLPSQLKAGGTLKQPAPLFKKLDESIIEEERSRLGAK